MRIPLPMLPHVYSQEPPDKGSAGRAIEEFFRSVQSWHKVIEEGSRAEPTVAFDLRASSMYTIARACLDTACMAQDLWATAGLPDHYLHTTREMWSLSAKAMEMASRAARRAIASDS